MCGRFVRSSPIETIVEEFEIEDGQAPEIHARYNVCPGEEILAVVREGGAARLRLLRWGLVPWFAKDPAAGPRSINARAEGVAERPAFRDAFRRRRCLVVADGFYEWRKVGSAKAPYLVRLRAGRPFGLAALWDRWAAPERALLETCTIVTCPANALVAPIHDRMPVIVPRAERRRWLDPTFADRAALSALLRPYPAEELEVYPVSRLVNSPRNDSPECVRRIDEPSEARGGP